MKELMARVLAPGAGEVKQKQPVLDVGASQHTYDVAPPPRQRRSLHKLPRA